jgi:excisionase family DNA binding protein
MNDIIVAMKDKAVYTLKEAADFLSISYSTIKRLARNAGLPVFKVGRQWRIKIEGSGDALLNSILLYIKIIG